MAASYTKLKSGGWGVRVEGQVKEGDTVTVTKKSGEKKQETVSRVLWRGDGVAICEVGEARRQPVCCACKQVLSRSRTIRGVRYCEDCGEDQIADCGAWSDGYAGWDARDAN